MSKSLGNGIDPMDMIEKYGADALRYYLTTSVSNGMDLKFDEEALKSTWNFINKLWNASRFVLMNLEGYQNSARLEEYSIIDEWILTKYNETVKKVTKFMDKFELNNAGMEIYNFIYDDFCDHYIEFAKFHMEEDNTKQVLVQVLKGILKMLHPFMPYVTDEIYGMIPNVSENIMVSDYPKYNKKEIFKASCQKVEHMIEFIKLYRKTYQENHMNKSAQVRFNNDEDYSLISQLLKIDHVIKGSSDMPSYSVHYQEFDATIYFEKEITEEEKEFIKKEIETLKASIAKRKGLLANQNFVSKAPLQLVEQEKEKLALEEEKLKKLEN